MGYTTMRIPVVGQNHKPLMPTTDARARKWLASSKAVKRWSDCGQFYVQLTGEPSGCATQEMMIGIDPGKKYSGIGVQSARFTLYTAHLILPFQTRKTDQSPGFFLKPGPSSEAVCKSSPGQTCPFDSSQ
jgi:RRXRR protein